MVESGRTRIGVAGERRVSREAVRSIPKGLNHISVDLLTERILPANSINCSSGSLSP